MIIASSNYEKIGVGMTKKKYKFLTSCSTSKTATPASAYLKKYFGSDFNKKHATPTSVSDSTTLA